jgi:hypothetical protein
VSDNLELKKNIFFLCPTPNIVDHKRHSIRCLPVGHDTDVEDTFPEIPGDEVSRMVVLRIFRDFNGRTISLEKLHQIRNPSVVDIRIRRFHTPLPGIMRKVGFHVFMYELLKIDIELPKRSDEDVCATTGLDRDVSPWVFQNHVGGIVRGRDADLASGRCNEDEGFFLRKRGGG